MNPLMIIVFKNAGDPFLYLIHKEILSLIHWISYSSAFFMVCWYLTSR